MIKALDKVIEATSFKPAVKFIEKQPEVIEEEKLIRKEVFFSWKRKDYAWISIYQNKVIIDISPELGITIESKLVNYIRRELDKYFQEDLQLEMDGKIDADKRFIYTIDEQDGKLTQIEFYDYGNETRRRDLLGKIRWALRTYAKENL
jgi:hypothetical protein